MPWTFILRAPSPTMFRPVKNQGNAIFIRFLCHRHICINNNDNNLQYFWFYMVMKNIWIFVIINY